MADVTPKGGMKTPSPEKPWLILYLRLQAELNAVSSVAIEVPALRPVAKALREAMGE